MKNTRFIRVLACLCMAAMLCNFMLVPGGMVSAEETPLTFADFGMNDSTTVLEGQIWGQLNTYTDVRSLAGQAFEGYVTLGYTQAHPLTSAHIFAKDAGGIGVFANGPELLGVGTYNADGTKNTTLVSVPMADYDIAYTEGEGFSEFKLYVKITAVSGNDVDLLICLNDQQIFEGTATGAASLLGPKAFIWGFNAPVSIRSTYAAPTEATYNQVTFEDFGLADQTFADGTQKTGRPAEITSLDGICINGKIQMGYHGNDVMHSVRFGQSEAPGSTCWNGVGFYAKSETELVFADYANYNDREIIKVLNVSDYNITYAGGMFSEFGLSIKFKSIPDTNHMWVTVTVNGKAFYSGLIAGAQDTLGCNIQLWANGATISLKSVLSEPSKPADPVAQQKVTFADFGMNDSTAALEGQLWGQLDSYTDVNSLEGKAFEGYVTLGYTEAHPLTAAHIFAKEAGGIGVYADGPEKIGVASYLADGTKKNTIVSVPLSDYGITYTEGVGISEFKISITIQSISGDNADLVIGLNDQQIFDGTVSGIVSLLGPKAFIWGFNAPVSVRSVYTAPEEGSYQQLTFDDFGLVDGTFAADTQKTGRPTTITTLDGVEFKGKLQMQYHGNDVMHSVRFGQSEAPGSTCWNGVGFYAKSETELVFADYANYNDREIIKVLPVADYDITYSDGIFSEFDFTVRFKNIPETSHMWVTVTVNGKAFYSGLIAGAQDTFGCNIQLWANGATITVKSVADENPGGSEGGNEEEIPTVAQTVTFADFGMNDSTAAVDGQLWGQATGYTDANSLVGIAFEGYICLGYTVAHPLTSVHIFAKDAGGIGFYADGPEKIGVASYLADGTKNNTIVSVPLSDYGITYTEDVGFSEFKISIIIKSTSNNNVDLVIGLNDKKIFDGTVPGLASLLGPKAFVWGFNAPVSIRSAYTAPKEGNYQKLTFDDFGFADGVFAADSQKTGRPTAITTFDGVEFKGKLQLQYHGNDVMHSVRFGQSEAPGSTCWNGVGFYAKGETELVFADYAHYNDREIIKVLSIADYDITYSDGMFSEFAFTIKFKNIPETRHMWVSVTVNGKAFYSGLVADAQDSFGCNIQLWANGATIGVKSVYATVLEEPNEADFKEVSFIDFGLDNQIVGHQLDGDLPAEYTSMNGLMFAGKLQMELSPNNHNQSVRIGTNATDRVCGIGLYTEAEDKLVLYHYTSAYWGNELVVITPADYGITYADEEGFSEFELKMFFKFVDENNLHLTVKINGITCYNKIVKNVGATMGTHLFVWGDNALITIKSSDNSVVPVPDPAPVITDEFKHISFADFGFEKTTVDINNNDLNGHGKVMSLDKVVFSDTLHFSEGAGARWFFGGVDSVWAGIVIEPTDSGNLVLSNVGTSGNWPAITFIPKIAGCKLVGEDVKITMSFEYVDSDDDGEKDDVRFGIWFNDKSYLDRSYYLTNKANDLGGHTLIHVAGENVTVSINPYYPPLDFREFGFTENWAAELGLKKKES